MTHGDYRLDNLMFASDDGGYPIAAVDWQTPGHGSASGDVSYFLGAGPLPEVRREIERGLVDQYCAALADYGVDQTAASCTEQGKPWYQPSPVKRKLAVVVPAAIGTKYDAACST